jgi:hypothetical protein
MSDRYDSQSPALSSPLVGAFPIQPDDGADLPSVTRQLRVTGAGGEIAVLWAAGGQTVEPVSAGDILDWRLRRVLATGTTATGLRGYY